jgi:formyl-CoA transferase
MLLAIGNDGQFARFSAAAGHPEWSADPLFSTMAARNQNRGVLIPVMQAVTRTRTTADWVTFLENKAVPCGPINTVSQAFADPQVHARNLVVNQAVALSDSAQEATKIIATVASPLRLNDTPPVLRHAPPALGEHTDVVLTELGLDVIAIAQLRQAGVV